MLFPRLPLLEAVMPLISRIPNLSAGRTAVVGVQHLLETTGSLIEALVQIGFRPENIALLGKSYSTSSSVVSRLRRLGVTVESGSLPPRPGGFRLGFADDVDHLCQTAIGLLQRVEVERLLALDDGGLFISRMSTMTSEGTEVAAIEQTTSGLVKTAGLRFGVVEVASSAAKRILESPMIARAVAERLPTGHSGEVCGVVGVGSVGRAVAQQLLRKRASVLLFDSNPSVPDDSLAEATWCSSLHELADRADLIFGCSGQDIFRNQGWLDSISGTRTLISCSSEDREFQSVLSRVVDNTSKPFASFTVELGKSTMRVLRGGFPLNFDGSAESVPAAEIQLTRYLLFSGILQSLLRESLAAQPLPSGGVMLLPRMQSLGATAWLSRYPQWRESYDPDVIPGFQNIDWIAERSGGRLEDLPGLEAPLGVLEGSSEGD